MNFRKIIEGCDVQPLLRQIENNPSLWNTDNVRTSKPYTVHYDVDDIILRFPRQDVNQWNTPAFSILSEAQRIVFSIMEKVRGEYLGRVLISRLPPGAKIPFHTDWRDDGPLFYSRYQIPLQVLPGVNFCCGGEVVYMEPGDIYWFNNSAEHCIVNKSHADRISMVVDIRPFTPHE